ncbi:MAG: M48 family metallopeptidase [Gammaproteobacteria bacterium]|nr:M48 family metallopeptidase [Gammaproteobacteria bacterium]
MKINGLYFDGKSSKGITAELSFGWNGNIAVCAGGEILTAPLDQVVISSRIGNTPRYFQFEQGGKFETTENDVVDACLYQFRPKAGLIHTLESRASIILISLLVVALFGWGFVVYGTPAVAKFLAERLPYNTYVYLSDETLELMDKRFLSPSKISEERQQQLQAIFNNLTSESRSEYEFKLLFRDSEKMGANAFALPSGTIVVTDQLVQLTENNQEILGILAHEIGHVIYRHSMRLAIHNSMIGFLILFITGDASSSSVFISTLPVTLIYLNYSREFEEEADLYAIKYLENSDINLGNLFCMMQKLAAAHKEDGKLPEFLSTHPDMDARIRSIRDSTNLESMDCNLKNK